MVEVKMTLPESAVKDAEELTEAFHMKSKAVTVETALGLTHKIADLAGPKGSLIVRDGNGKGFEIDLRPLFAS